VVCLFMRDVPDRARIWGIVEVIVEVRELRSVVIVVASPVAMEMFRAAV
jgi:hypothetical protein